MKTQKAGPSFLKEYIPISNHLGQQTLHRNPTDSAELRSKEWKININYGYANLSEYPSLYDAFI